MSKEQLGYEFAVRELITHLRRRRSVRMIVRAYGALGAFLAVIGGAYFILSLIHVTLTRDQLTALLTSGVGVALAIVAWLFREIEHERESDELQQRSQVEQLYGLLRAWAEFELVIIGAGADGIGGTPSLGAAMSKLQETGRISDIDLHILQEALQARNAIVHGGVPIPPLQAESLTHDLRMITEKIKQVSELTGHP